MDGVSTFFTSGQSLTDRSAGLQQILRAVDGFFDPGIPISAKTFLNGLIKLLNVDQSALVLCQRDDQYRVMRVLDNSLHNAPHDVEKNFNENIVRYRAWTKDPVANKVHKRCTRRPSAGFCYSARRLAATSDPAKSYSIEFLNHMGAQHELTSVRQIEGKIYSLLSIFRLPTDAPPFNRTDRRLLKHLHHGFSNRIINLRDRAIRDQLAPVLHKTFSLLIAGHSEKEIARETNRSRDTIHEHIRRIYQHFNVSSRSQLMARFVNSEGLRDFSGTITAKKSDSGPNHHEE